ncbi:sugar transporter stl1 [Alternaria burnsii]|uniref:Sugar transporter stl1 n=1 Tax=Alternaria burnsii TaxID=1187904 RepID=A0A8H7B7H8_9PLEO|nr:sugar transporter stl1 [Alternaria burnsii]KAF7678996.1 sugar transporter stl1 [Alternaria burnsii]
MVLVTQFTTVYATDFVQATITPSVSSTSTLTTTTATSSSAALRSNVLQSTISTSSMVVPSQTLLPASSETAIPVAPEPKFNDTFAYVSLAAIITLAVLQIAMVTYLVYLRFKGECLHCHDLQQQLRKWKSGELKPITPQMVWRRDALNKVASASNPSSNLDVELGFVAHEMSRAPTPIQFEIDNKPTLFQKARAKVSRKDKSSIHMPDPLPDDGVDRFFTVNPDAPINNPEPSRRTTALLPQTTYNAGNLYATRNSPYPTSSIYSQDIDPVRTDGNGSRVFSDIWTPDIANMRGPPRKESYDSNLHAGHATTNHDPHDARHKERTIPTTPATLESREYKEAELALKRASATDSEKDGLRPSELEDIQEDFSPGLTRALANKQMLYLHNFTFFPGKWLVQPERAGFLKNQVVPFRITSKDGERLFAWLIAPLGVYARDADAFIQEKTGTDVEHTLAWRLLRDDPEARLLIYFHGNSATLAQERRTIEYRSYSAGASEKMFVLAFDYRGFGISTGDPSESGLLNDAEAVIDWALNTCLIPPERIVLLGHSLGTAVVSGIAHRYATNLGIEFAGLILCAAFTNAGNAFSSYSIGGIVPVLAPVKVFPAFQAWFARRMVDTWRSDDRLATMARKSIKAHNIVGLSQKFSDVQISSDPSVPILMTWPGTCSRFKLVLVHAESDQTMPWHETESLFQSTLRAAKDASPNEDNLKSLEVVDLGEAGRQEVWQSNSRSISKTIAKHGGTYSS